MDTREQIEAAYARIAQQSKSESDRFKFGVARQVLDPLMYELVYQTRGHGMADRAKTSVVTSEDVLQRLMNTSSLDALVDWAKERSNVVAQALEMENTLLGSDEHGCRYIDERGCRYIMYTDKGQICFEGNQAVSESDLGRAAVAIIEMERANLLLYAQSRGAVMTLASAKKCEDGSRPENDHLRMDGYYFCESLEKDLHPLTKAQTRLLRKAEVIGADSVRPLAEMGEGIER
ncbi:MAG: hypothetical protein ACOYJ2_07500 [Rickettsiales bacterium]